MYHVLNKHQLAFISRPNRRSFPNGICTFVHIFPYFSSKSLSASGSASHLRQQLYHSDLAAANYTALCICIKSIKLK